MFNSMKAFKRMHKEKLIEGKNRFAPCECEWFLYSKQLLPVYSYAIMRPIEFSMKSEPALTTAPVCERIELRRLPGPPDEDGFYSYVKDSK